MAQTTQTRGLGGDYSGTVLFLTMGDVNACESSIKALRQYYTFHIQFMPTVYWTGSVYKPAGWCIKDENYQCSNDATLKQRWQAGIQACIQTAVNYGFNRISVIVHGDYEPSYVWRNQLSFDPTVSSGGESYNSIGLLPVATALRAVLASQPNARGYFAMAGEMGTSTFQYPLSWLALYNSYKTFFNNYKILVGTELNYQKVCNCVNTQISDPFTYAAEYNKSAPAAIAKTGWSKANAVKFLQATDFLSVSIYHPVTSATPPVTDFTRGLDWFSDELASWGFSLDAYNKIKPLHIGESGFGGADADGVSVAPNYQYAIRHPFFGVWYPAGSNNPWLIKLYSSVRRAWHRTLFLWLQSQQKTRFYIEVSFNFCAGSFDFMGVQPQSTGFYDGCIANNLKSHNRVTHGLAPLALCTA